MPEDDKPDAVPLMPKNDTEFAAEEIHSAQGPAGGLPSPATSETIADGTGAADLDAAVHAACLDTSAAEPSWSVDQTLDQLTTSVDLFDVVPFDFGDAT